MSPDHRSRVLPQNTLTHVLVTFGDVSMTLNVFHVPSYLEMAVSEAISTQDERRRHGNNFHAPRAHGAHAPFIPADTICGGYFLRHCTTERARTSFP